MAGRFSFRRMPAPEPPAPPGSVPGSGFAPPPDQMPGQTPEEAAPAADGIAWTVFQEGTPEAASMMAPLPPAPPPPVPASPVAPANAAMREKLLDAKVRLHRRLIEEINLAALEKLPEDEIRKHIQQLVSQYVLVERLALNTQELADFVTEILDEMTGLGPIEPLLKDASVNDILINGHECVYVERRGILEPTAVRFKDEAHLLRIINKIVSAVGRRVDESHPLCDARLLDGSRVNVAVRPVAVDGPLVSIRKFSKKPLGLDKLVEVGALRPQMAELLAAMVKARVTTIISGGTGSGKTTMLNALSAFISDKERLITIEDAAELQLQQPHVARMETRPPNVEGKGEIRQRDLVKNALRMRPERIILGECRGEEAFDMLQAMNTGHEGSMATIHANNPREAISRLEQMIGMAGLPMTITSIRGQIAAAVRIIVQLSRLSDGKRRVMSIAEITGMEGEILQMQEIFKYVRTATLEDGTVQGHFVATGVRPRILSDLAAKGIKIPPQYFDPSKPL
ncbi:Type II/IV secretion system ATP hydrolase TadA/VirB11/CpaF, TadA subfamily [Rhodovulum sp. PH10]|uniref:CpaF family protein n=1 Tax=Rhodovulum sp. PH10 TaxID=1187851 RepID=UPI00027C2BE3|nr:CpaF family protein [Rhodovulum sp. PH10]EJW12425.1 Type II/IV secretion system ATP hydrolase TadA/VirB11/CpaF, TadA subfamily [Rhodovulum sp. PH10]